MSQSTRTWLNLLEWAMLALAVLAFTITEQYQWYVTAGLMILIAAFILRWVRTGQLLPRTGLELPLLLFLGSAGLSTWLSVEQGNARLQLARMFGAAVLFYAVLQSDKRFRPWFVAGVVLVTLGLACYWPLQHDFSADMGKFPWITRFGQWLNQRIPAISGPYIHANVAASTFTPGLAFAAGLAAWAGKRKPWLVVFSCVAILILLVALLLTGSRGAWFGVVVTVLLTGLVLLQRAWLPSKLRLRLFWGSIILIAVLSGVFLTLTHLWEPLLGQVPDPSGSFQSRLSLWKQVLLLIGDAPFTGYGLMSFRMAYAIYGIMIHVPLHDHAHNTFLEVGMEQGLVGLFALLWGMAWLLRGAWRAMEHKTVSPLAWAGISAISILTVHSLFDVIYYVMRPLPLIGICLGMAGMIAQTPSLDNSLPKSSGHRQPRWLPAVIVLILGAAMVAGFRRPLLAAWFGNLGVVEQTRLELSAYDATHFDNPTLDEVRQQLDLCRAVDYFEQALRWQPANRTASQRLAQIYLSRGEYSQAMTLMQVAWDAGHRDEITCLLLGDALVAQGDPKAAAEIVRGLPQATGRLNTQAWYRYYRQGDYARAASAYQAVLALDPENTHALNGLNAIPQP